VSHPSFRLLVFNKPMGVLTRFTDDDGRKNLSHFIDVPKVYPIGRLDLNSEGLLLLTDRGTLVAPLLKPGAKRKTYVVCVEGQPTPEQLALLRAGPRLKDGPTMPAEVVALGKEPEWLWARKPPIRFRKSVPTSWLSLTILEGRNRQVRRMTAAVGLPTLRLVRTGFGPFELEGTPPGQWREATAQEKRWVLDFETPSGKKPSKPGPRRGRNRTRT
jgi:23S rRNA pseudouridine2457 synthase